MKSKQNIVFVPLIMLLLHTGGWSQTGANLLDIYPGARAIAMGGAFTGVATDASCTYYNQAGLGFIDRAMTSSTYLRWQFGRYPDIHYLFTSVVIPLGPYKGLGFNIAYLTAGNVVTYGVVTSEEYSNPIDQGMSYDLAVNLSYGWRVLQRVGAGIAIKYVHANHYTCWGPWEMGTTYAADFSLLYKGRLSLGAIVQNIGDDLIYDETGRHDPLPKILRLGASYELLSYYDEYMGIDPPLLLISAQATKILYEIRVTNVKEELNDISWQIGMEYWYYGSALRVGYFYDKYERNRIKNGITYGIGLSLAGLEFGFALDSSVHNFPESNYYFTLNCNF
ncbi:MAG TPA: PorV/PorQ family protein [bacterium (Candidatus Stahlbacteria)]|nr:PorV/PorQ family protein [Candidatus Stahlbacteria bacterium]